MERMLELTAGMVSLAIARCETSGALHIVCVATSTGSKKQRDEENNACQRSRKPVSPWHTAVRVESAAAQQERKCSARVFGISCCKRPQEA
jgi:hypothetical protein